MNDIIGHYKELNNICNGILDQSLSDEQASLVAQSHSFLFDYGNWLKILEHRPEYPIYKMAVREYQMAIISSNIGLYNQAFLGLRFFFERTLIAVLFSSKEIDLRLWQRGERDTYWQELIDENTGIFSHNFCRAFFPDLKDEILHFRRITQKVYRECSEYVHGNLSVQSKIPDILLFDEFLFNEWHAKAAVIKRVILFTFCLRYSLNFNTNVLYDVESITIENFGHIAAIRDLFDLPNTN